MINIAHPKYDIDEPARAKHCKTVFSSVIRHVVAQSVASGWREAEAALALADACDDYILHLATKPKKKPEAANKN
jgi:hypothetical protein